MDKSPQNPQNIVTMSDYQPETGYTAIAQVEAYWEAIRGNRLIPKRSDIDPRGIEHALEHAFILERIAPGVARIRLAGTHLNEIIGMESRGMPLTAFFTPAARAGFSEMLEEVFQSPATGSLSLTSAKAIGRPALDARLVLLPLKSDLGDISRVLGCWVCKGKIGSAPRRFDITSKRVTRLVADPTAQTEPATTPKATKPTAPPLGPKAKPQVHENAGFAEGQTPFKSKDVKRRPPYLRLINSDD